MKATVIAIYKGKPLPVMSRENKEFVDKVSFMEAITEATAQLILSCLVLRSFGIGTDSFSMCTQTFSMLMSLISIVFAFGNVRNLLIILQIYFKALIKSLMIHRDMT